MSLANLIELELQAVHRWAVREDELLADAADGKLFWGEGKQPVEPGDISGLAEYLPRERTP